MRPATTSKRGILNPKAGELHFELSRHAPSPDLDFFVERYWIVRWDLRGRAPYVSQTLPHPSINVVCEDGDTRAWGVQNDRFHRTLEGKSAVFGIKFRPGAFYPFLRSSVSDLTDRDVGLDELFGIDSKALAKKVLRTTEVVRQIAIIEAMLRERLPPKDANVALIGRVIHLLLEETSLQRVEDVCERLGVSERTLQRLFRRYVGVSPKWVIQRIRVHEAAERLSQGRSGDWAQLAVELGYFDQAHFIHDFKALVGKSPAEYAAACAAFLQASRAS